MIEQQIREAFLAAIAESDAIETEMCEELGSLLSSSTKKRADNLVAIFSRQRDALPR